MINAEISIYPIGTSTTSASFYIAKAIEVLKEHGLKFEVTPMGTIIESNDFEKVFDASKDMANAVHNLGVGRVEIILKIDSRRDKNVSMNDKMNSLKRYMD